MKEQEQQIYANTVGKFYEPNFSASVTIGILALSMKYIIMMVGVISTINIIQIDSARIFIKLHVSAIM